MILLADSPIVLNFLETLAKNSIILARQKQILEKNF